MCHCYAEIGKYLDTFGLLSSPSRTTLEVHTDHANLRGQILSDKGKVQKIASYSHMGSFSLTLTLKERVGRGGIAKY